jgi:hypothetical protein
VGGISTSATHILISPILTDSATKNANDDVEQDATQETDQNHRHQREVELHGFAFITKVSWQIAQPGEVSYSQQNQQAGEGNDQPNDDKQAAEFNHQLGEIT